MSVLDYMREHILNGDPKQAKNAAVRGIVRRYASIHNYGTPIWEHDWDVLLVLDACRYDLFHEVVEDYEFIDEYRPTYSVASDSPTWIRRTFGELPAKNTGYITGNPWSSEVTINATYVEEVWRTGWNDDLGTIYPNQITRAAAEYFRNHDRPMVVHYMQPHVPFLNYPELNTATGTDEWVGDVPEQVWDRLRNGDVSYEEVWTAYRDNLRLVLDNIGILLNCIDADRVGITSDHGNAMGEFGIYGHPTGIPIPPIRRVPFAVSSAQRTRDPPEKMATEPTEVNSTVQDRLSDLGYVN